MFSGRGQIESILSFGGHTVSVTIQSSSRKAAVRSVYMSGCGRPPATVFCLPEQEVGWVRLISCGFMTLP